MPQTFTPPGEDEKREVACPDCGKHWDVEWGDATGLICSCGNAFILGEALIENE